MVGRILTVMLAVGADMFFAGKGDRRGLTTGQLKDRELPRLVIAEGGHLRGNVEMPRADQ